MLSVNTMRLDVFLTENNLYKSRNKAVEGIKKGEVLINGNVIDKPSYDVNVATDKVEICAEEKPFVSLGGYKMQRAINYFMPQIDGKIFLDVGASTGGFTDCLLRHNAKKVYAIDVGEGLLDKTIACDERVCVMDRTNARYLIKEQFETLADGITVDCSFISLEYILPPLINLLKEDGYILALIKPQFETGKRMKVKNGILRDDKEIIAVLTKMYQFVINLNLVFCGAIKVTVDKNKNREYIAMIKKEGENIPLQDLLKCI